MSAKEAMFQTREADGSVRCGLCPRRCRIEPGKSGYCRVRTNRDGVLYAETYRHPVALQVDPIEKKPFHWFLPGSSAFSIGTFGCNLGCRFCQNSQLSRGDYRRSQSAEVPPEAIVRMAKQYNCESVAYNYNEPAVFIEYILEVAELAHAAGLKNLLVS